jgi:alkanesulfonate monooxygenase SsuD/methylene tetrahydromethanopterin reductase-like flavin-dependent oxidoreductase (luciferase family)
MPELRFGVLVVPDAPFPTLAERWRRGEELGFDFLFVADHYRHTRDPSLTWFEGWTVLAAMALQTSRVRIGPLVANPILRGPAVLAKAAAAVDHLSNGRLELAIGKGAEEFDHQAPGTRLWSPRERAARFREYIQVVDGALRNRAWPRDPRGFAEANGGRVWAESTPGEGASLAVAFPLSPAVGLER